MCKGISILKARLTLELFERYELASRVAARGGEPELHFIYTDRVVALPVFRDGQIEIIEWGSRGNKASKLPRTGWCKTESLEAGKWQWLEPQRVEILADFGLEKGVWFQVVQGIHGVVVHDEQERPHVYMLTKPASHYYEMMTKHNRMPVLIEQEI